MQTNIHPKLIIQTVYILHKIRFSILILHKRKSEKTLELINPIHYTKFSIKNSLKKNFTRTDRLTNQL